MRKRHRVRGTLSLLATLTAALLASPAMAHPAPALSGALYSGPAAGSESWQQPRTVVDRGMDRNVYNTSQPRFDLYLPEPDKATGAAVLLLPGGGLRVLGMGQGTDGEVAAFLAEGVAVMVLEYRTLQLTAEQVARASAPPPADAPPMRFPKMEIRNGNANPSPADPVLGEVLRLATQDAQTALAMLHARAAEWRIDPDRIGLIGTSAGGGVGFSALLADAPAPQRPDFLISIFGPSLQDITPPASDAPPLYLVTEADHGPVTDGLLAAFSIWKGAGHKAELHVYEVPNFSMTADLWSGRLFDWMRERGILPAR